MSLRRFADAIHEGLKDTGPEGQCWDVWLQPKVLDSLRQWRESLEPASWARAAQISGHLAGGRRVTAASLAPWHMASRGYLHAAAGA